MFNVVYFGSVVFAFRLSFAAVARRNAGLSGVVSGIISVSSFQGDSMSSGKVHLDPNLGIKALLSTGLLQQTL
jgi:hypothetical protein